MGKGLMKKSQLIIVIILLGLPLRLFSSDSLFHELRHSDEPHKKAQLLNRIADYYLDFDLDSARFYADSALELGKKENNFRAVSDAWVNLGNVHYFQGALDSALLRYQNSFFAIRKTGNLDEIAAAHNRLGLMYEAKGEFARATDYYYKALRYFERSNNKSGMAEVANNLGIIHNHFGQLDVALDYYKKSLELFRKNREPGGKAQVINNIATLYTEQNNPDTALQYLFQAADIFTDMRRPSDLATAYINIGNHYYEKSQPDSARHYLELAKTNYSKQDNKRGLSSVYYYMALLQQDLGQIEQAILSAKKSAELRREVGNISAVADAIGLLANLYAQQDRYKKAYSTILEKQEIEDSIAKMEMQLKFSELQLKYETAKKDKAILILKKQAQARRNFNTLLIIGISALVIISLLLFYFFRTKSRLLKSNRKYYEQQKKLHNLDLQRQEAETRLLAEEMKRKEENMTLEKEKFEAELEHKSRELLTSAMHIVNKNKILASIRDTLDDISFNAEPAFRQKARRLCADIDRNIHVDSDWEQFKMHFDQVNTGFFEKLESDFPQLSKSDMKVCAYLKINLSTKEIAQIMNVSPAAVHKRFYRLRKKMELEPNTNLTKFFMAY
ncbi:MAG: tetratricopeptide repeat protein [Bacteroidales bacterium]